MERPTMNRETHPLVNGTASLNGDVYECNRDASRPVYKFKRAP